MAKWRRTRYGLEKGLHHPMSRRLAKAQSCVEQCTHTPSTGTTSTATRRLFFSLAPNHSPIMKRMPQGTSHARSMPSETTGCARQDGQPHPNEGGYHEQGDGVTSERRLDDCPRITRGSPTEPSGNKRGSVGMYHPTEVHPNSARLTERGTKKMSVRTRGPSENAKPTTHANAGRKAKPMASRSPSPTGQAQAWSCREPASRVSVIFG